MKTIIYILIGFTIILNGCKAKPFAKETIYFSNYLQRKHIKLNSGKQVVFVIHKTHCSGCRQTFEKLISPKLKHKVYCITSFFQKPLHVNGEKVEIIEDKQGDIDKVNLKVLGVYVLFLENGQIVHKQEVSFRDRGKSVLDKLEYFWQ